MSTTPSLPHAKPASDEPRFVVKLRNLVTRSWGNETEVAAVSARAAAELVAEQPLADGPGQRENLRARVWTLPYGASPELHFYVAR